MSLSRIEIHKKIQVLLCMCIAFFLPIARLVPIFISLMLLNWLIEGDFKSKFKVILRNKYALLFIALYVLHLIGLAYTSNMDSGLFDIQVKASLLILPLMLCSKPLEANTKQMVFLAFISGCVSSIVFLLLRATYIFFSNGENHFFYEDLSSYLIHPSYLAMYLNVGIAWLILSNRDNQYRKISPLISTLLLIVFSTFIFMLSSKSGIITMILMYVGFIIYFITAKKKYFLGISSLLVIALLILGVMKFVPEISARISRAVHAVTHPSADQKDVESTAVRLLVWQASSKVISENILFGVGTGDSKDKLMSEYKSEGIEGAYAHELNAHNEYLQVFVSLGLIGFISLFSIFWFPFFHSIKTKNAIYMLFLLLVSLNFLTESMFETQAGVMFYAFFNSMLCFDKPKS